MPVRPAHALAGLDATVVHPGAASEARRWPAERWVEVIRAERARGRVVVLTGSASEQPLAERIAAAAGLPPTAVLAGHVDLTGLAALVAAAGRLVCGDTGVAHLATATRTPSVVLFGPVSPERWGPPADRPWHRALWQRTEGAGDPHADRPDPALLAIEPAAVAAALADLPLRPAAAFPSVRPPANQPRVTARPRAAAPPPPVPPPTATGLRPGAAGR
nr:glycosyltransferase family 9 protein [Conexibacter arvalis]